MAISKSASSSAHPSHRRRFSRVSYEKAALVRTIGTNRPFEEFAKTRVLGAGGCMFVSRESLGFSTLMELMISCRGRVIKTDSRVVYEIRRGSGEYEVGVEFLRISPTDRAHVESIISTSTQAA
jgi:c-di-GMP-binding flagellar brake protein YcgR